MDINTVIAILLPLILNCFNDEDDDEGALRSIKNPNRRQRLVVRWSLRRAGASRLEIQEVFTALEDLTDEEAREILEAAKEK